MHPELVKQLPSRLHNAASLAPFAIPAELMYRRWRKSVDLSALERLQMRCRTFDLGFDERTKKYLRYGFYVRESIIRALRMGLHKSSGLRVLDLGCGTGYFLNVCKYLGHQVHGLDVGDNLLYEKFLQFFDVPWTCQRIEPLQQLSMLEGPYDLITAFSITFDHKGGERWDDRHWQYFLQDLRGKLSPGGRIHFRLNVGGSHLPNKHHVEQLLTDCDGYQREMLDYRTVRFQRAA